MAERTLYVDDLELAKDPNTTTPAEHVNYSIGLDGTTYVIDLAADNRKRLEEALAPFVLAARFTGRLSKPSKPSRASGPLTAPIRLPGAVTDKEENDRIRRWAAEEGMNVGVRGRIPSHIIEAYKNRNIDEEPEIPILDRIKHAIQTESKEDYEARLHAWARTKMIQVMKGRGRPYGVTRADITRFEQETGVLPPK